MGEDATGADEDWRHVREGEVEVEETEMREGEQETLNGGRTPRT